MENYVSCDVDQEGVHQTQEPTDEVIGTLEIDEVPLKVAYLHHHRFIGMQNKISAFPIKHDKNHKSQWNMIF